MRSKVRKSVTGESEFQGASPECKGSFGPAGRRVGRSAGGGVRSALGDGGGSEGLPAAECASRFLLVVFPRHSSSLSVTVLNSRFFHVF